MQGACAPCRIIIYGSLDLRVYKDVYRLILKIFEYTRELSHEYKYTLGQELKRDREKKNGVLHYNKGYVIFAARSGHYG